LERVVLPVTASERALALCAERGVEVTPAPLSPSSLLETAAAGGIDFAADRRGGYVFPAFLPAFDAAAALAKLASLLGRADVALADLVDAMPPMPLVHHEVATPFEQKGLIMRTLIEQVSEAGERVELVDGIKVLTDAGWVLVVPDPHDPVTHVWAEAADGPASEDLAARYAERVRTIEG
jgi:mannose-1-phosphate guanylyltransferase/phosphomannomutase